MLSRQVTLFREVQSFRLRACHGRLCVRHLARLRRADDRRLRPDRFRRLGERAADRRLPARDRDRDRRVVVDRLPRRRLMIASDLARVAIFAVLPFANDPGTIVALAALAGFATGFPSGALRRTRTWCPTRIFPRELAAPDDRERRLGPRPRPGRRARCSHGPRRGVLDQFRHVPRLGGPPRGHSGPAAAVGPGGGAGLLARPHRRLQLVRDSRALLTVLAAWNVVMLATAAAECRRGRARQGHLRRRETSATASSSA